MKTLVVFAAVLLAASQLSAQNQPATKAEDPTTSEVKTLDKTTTPTDKGITLTNKTTPPTDKTTVKKVEKKLASEPKIPGLTIVRPNGTLLGLEVAGGNFKLSFYDKKKKPMAPDVTRATARWPNSRGPGDLRTVLNVSGNALVSEKPVPPPYVFRVYLTLLQGEGAEAKAVENFIVQFQG
jgi:hypothetical protein